MNYFEVFEKMEDQELNEIINQVLGGYRKEVSSMLHHDLSLLSTIDWVFFSDPDQDLSRDFIDGFCLALFYCGKIKNEVDVLRLQDIITSQRTLLNM